MTREEFIKQRCKIDKITLEKFEEQYRVVECNCGQPYCKGYRCLDLDDLLKENQELKKQLHEASLTIQEMTEQDFECPSNCEKLRRLEKQLEKRKYYKFYKYENNPNGSDYCFCERPCDSNMSLNCFLENGEICGFMSESLVDNHDNIEEISLNEFAHDFIKPLINANFQNKNQQKKFIKWLEAMNKMYQNEYKDINAAEHYNCVLKKYQEIIGDDK